MNGPVVQVVGDNTMNEDPTYVGNSILSLKQATGWSTTECADYVLTTSTVEVVDTIAEYNRRRNGYKDIGRMGHSENIPVNNSTLSRCPVLECRCYNHEEGTYHSNPECPFFID